MVYPSVRQDRHADLFYRRFLLSPGLNRHFRLQRPACFPLHQKERWSSCLVMLQDLALIRRLLLLLSYRTMEVSVRIELTIRVLQTLALPLGYETIMAVYTGVEPVSSDRQSLILAVRRIDHWFQIRELNPVKVAYEATEDTDLPSGIW